MKFFPEIKLVIAGEKSGSYYKELVKTANKEGVENHVVFVGIISEEEKTWLYRNCKAFLFPSLYEGFGLPVIEAMRNGAPAIISNSSSLPEIGGGHAFYFNSYLPESMFEVIEDSLDKFSKNPELRISQISYANNFTWEKNVECYLKLYKEILSII
jgi:glycosyltransferase involved in cell wall biosynthesis